MNFRAQICQDGSSCYSATYSEMDAAVERHQKKFHYIKGALIFLVAAAAISGIVATGVVGAAGGPAVVTNVSVSICVPGAVIAASIAGFVAFVHSCPDRRTVLKKGLHLLFPDTPKILKSLVWQTKTNEEIEEIGVTFPSTLDENYLYRKQVDLLDISSKHGFEGSVNIEVAKTDQLQIVCLSERRFAIPESIPLPDGLTYNEVEAISFDTTSHSLILKKTGGRGYLAAFFPAPNLFEV